MLLRPPHLRRLFQIWVNDPVYFITTTTDNRRPLLANDAAAAILVGEWRQARERHGWFIGRYSIMPDHVHFFAAGHQGAKSMPLFMAFWKEWTSKHIAQALRIEPPVWQHRFFDHLLRSDESRSAKWSYIRNNPVEAGFVKHPDDWPYQGYIDFA